jgi:hypothetical protein
LWRVMHFPVPTVAAINGKRRKYWKFEKYAQMIIIEFIEYENLQML